MPTVLIVAASPLDQDRLRLGAEIREVRRALQRSRNRENWKIESNEAVTVDDLRLAMLDLRPAVVHFSGHGDGANGLCFEDTDGNTHRTGAMPLAKLLHHFKDDLKCVVLNACYSDIQAEVIRNEIDYVIGMRSAVNDDSAAKFAVAFYDAVFAGTDFRTAFDLGCTALDLNNLPDSDVPIFMTGSHLEKSTLSYTSHIPEVERVLYAYFNTPYHERATLTTAGDVLQGDIVKYYGEKLHRAVDKVQVLAMKLLTEDQWRVAVEVSGGSDRQQTVVYVRIRNRSVLVEWQASVGFWSLPVKTYLALGSNTPVVARVEAELDDYYNYDFSDKEQYFQSVLLGTKTRETLHGYVSRHAAVYNELMAILSDGNPHSITLEIINSTNQTSTPLIRRLLSSTWLYDPVCDSAGHSNERGAEDNAFPDR